MNPSTPLPRPQEFAVVPRLPDSWWNWNLEMLVLEERGKPEQRREPTTSSTHIWRRSLLSSLRHPWSPVLVCNQVTRRQCWMSKKEFFTKNLHENRVKFQEETNAFVLDHHHGRRDVTCKPAIALVYFVSRCLLNGRFYFCFYLNSTLNTRKLW